MGREPARTGPGSLREGAASQAFRRTLDTPNPEVCSRLSWFSAKEPGRACTRGAGQSGQSTYSVPVLVPQSPLGSHLGLVSSGGVLGPQAGSSPPAQGPQGRQEAHGGAELPWSWQALMAGAGEESQGAGGKGASRGRRKAEAVGNGAGSFLCTEPPLS